MKERSLLRRSSAAGVEPRSRRRECGGAGDDGRGENNNGCRRSVGHTGTTTARRHTAAECALLLPQKTGADISHPAQEAGRPAAAARFRVPTQSRHPVRGKEGRARHLAALARGGGRPNREGMNSAKEDSGEARRTWQHWPARRRTGACRQATTFAVAAAAAAPRETRRRATGTRPSPGSPTRCRWRRERRGGRRGGRGGPGTLPSSGGRKAGGEVLSALGRLCRTYQSRRGPPSGQPGRGGEAQRSPRGGDSVSQRSGGSSPPQARRKRGARSG